jgi:hypothetical protein
VAGTSKYFGILKKIFEVLFLPHTDEGKILKKYKKSSSHTVKLLLVEQHLCPKPDT